MELHPKNLLSAGQGTPQFRACSGQGPFDAHYRLVVASGALVVNVVGDVITSVGGTTVADANDR